MLIPQYGHIPWSYRQRSLVVSDLSLNRRQNIPITSNPLCTGIVSLQEDELSFWSDRFKCVANPSLIRLLKFTLQKARMERASEELAESLGGRSICRCSFADMRSDLSVLEISRPGNPCYCPGQKHRDR